MSEEELGAVDLTLDRIVVDGVTSRLDVLVTEYSCLKSEQLQRISVRDNLSYLQLTLVGALFAFGLSEDLVLQSLLVAPWICFVIGRLYVVQDQRVSAIGEYIQNNLDCRVQKALADSGGSVFAWESAPQRLTFRTRRKTSQLLSDLAVFPGTGAVALLFASYGQGPLSGKILTILILGEAVLLGFLVVEILIWAKNDRAALPTEVKE